MCSGSRRPPAFVIVCPAMSHLDLSALLEFIGHDLSPVRAVILFFVIGYVVVGLPVHFRQGAASRDVWGTAAGVTMAALYAAFIAGVYPWLHHMAVVAR
jgi:RsiW-degrading membrane proteinase PrsW (M82 family)